MASLDFEHEKVAFNEFYGSNLLRIKAAEESFRTLITSLLSGSLAFPVPVVSSRLKDRDECVAKFVRKYQTDLEEQETPYEIKGYITDLIGVRVTCYYETDVPLIRELLSENFEVLEVTDKTSSLELRDDTFGYKGLHLDLKLNDQRRTLLEYVQFAGFQFEVQIRTIIQHAWSELDHKIKYKKSPPATLKRKINRLAALFELADQEFVNIRIETEERERQLRNEPDTISSNDTYSLYFQKLSSLLEKVSVGEDDSLDAFKFLSLVTGEFPTYHFLPDKVDDFVQGIRRLAPDVTQGDLQQILENHLPTVRRYADFQAERHIHLNPYTILRHTLYLSDPNKFALLLFYKQRVNFETWLNSGADRESEARNSN
jgi:ppGpp synthetase/RelA/SpoT-type nucleotidyltranferase